MKYKIKLGIIFILSAQYAYALEDEMQIEKLQAVNLNPKIYAFDARSLFGSKNQDIDLRQFSSLNTIATGTYSLSTSINHERSLGQLTLKFEHLDANQSAVLCIDETLLQRLDLRQEVLQNLPKQACLTIKDISPDAYYDLDHADLSLNLSLPLAIINHRPEGYIAPELFDKGVTSAYLSYDFNTYTNKLEQNSIVNKYLSLNGGFNLGAFNYRHAGSFSSNGEHLGKYYSSLNALSTDVVPLKARLTAGDFATQSYYIENAQIVGLQLASDISMRPMSQRNYTPVIRGVANTNALVSIFQNGRKIYERTVPAGAFEFNDLTATDNYGDLTVEVTENGGEKHRFIVPMQSNMSLIRVGQLNYNIASGQYKLNNKVTDDYLSQFSFEYGLSNYLSIYAGSNWSSPFQSYLLGLGANTLLGGIRLDAEHADSTLAGQDYTGQKYQLAYRYNYAPFNTSLNISTQYQSQQYMTLGNTMSLLNFDNLNQAEVDNLFQTYQLKQQWNLSLYQTLLKDGWGSLYLNTSVRKYWNSPKDYQQYDIGYANHWNKLNYSLGYTQLDSNINNDREQRVYLSLSMPMNWSNKRANLNASIQNSDTAGHPTTANLGVTGTVGDNGQLGYGLTTNQSWDEYDNRSSVSANVNYYLPQIQLGAVIGHSDRQSQYGLSARGALVAHPHGVTATNNLSDTFTVIHADGAQGADVINAWGIKIDRFGNAIYSSLSPYEINTISLDTKHLPIDVQFSSNQAEVIPRRYSSTLLKFDTAKTSNILLNVHIATGQQIPIGVQAMNVDGQVVGMFGQSNQLFVEKADLLQQDINVSWGVTDMKSCRIAVPAHHIQQQTKSKAFQMIDVECK